MLGSLMLLTVLAYAGMSSSQYAQAGSSPNQAGWTQHAKLTAGNGSDGDHFGYSVAIDGARVVVGAVGDGDYAGAAYVFSRTGDSWVEEAKLTASDRARDAKFGYSVSISGNSILIGARGHAANGPNSGAAYVFVWEAGTWTEQARLLPGDGAAGDQFGWRVAIDGDTALIAAIGHDDNGSDSGAVYVFTRAGNAWTEQARLSPSDGGAGQRFGRSLSLHGNDAVIAAQTAEDEFGNYSGAAYVFVRDGNTWLEQAKLTATNGTPSDRFGYSTAIGDGYALVGAIGDGDNGSFSGAVYAFARNGSTWTQQAKLTAGDGAAWDRFGYSASVDGGTAVVGAIGGDGMRANSGTAYIFLRSGDTWVENTRLVADDGDEDDQFGYSVAISESAAVFGAVGDDDNGDLSGSAYVFVGPATPPTPTVIATAIPTATPTSGPTSPATTTPIVTPTATSTTPARPNYLPLIARQWQTITAPSPVEPNSPGQ